jgi:hypothetical protein
MPTIRLPVADFAVQNASLGKLLLMPVFLSEKLILKFLDLLLQIFNILIERFNLFIDCLTQLLERGILVHH